MSNIDHLIISNMHDYSTDLICLEMEKRKLNYLRLNRDLFTKYEIEYDFEKETLTVKDELSKNYIINSIHLNSIYFRAPTFIRSFGRNKLNLEEQLYQGQWNSFIRNLIIFENVKWVNNPVQTYRAENKMYQLLSAKKEGFLIPKTVLTNHNSHINNSANFIVKSLDTALFYDDGKEMFTYANVVTEDELAEYNLKTAPFFLQEFLEPKEDIRVTVIGDRIFSVKILKQGKGVQGDWRREKGNLMYQPISLPNDITHKIRNLMKRLNLNFGGIDLAFANDQYYFIEINPTGEWGWLDRTASLPIAEAIVNYLSS